MTLVDLFGRILCFSIYGSIAGAGVWLIGLLIDHVRAPKGISLILWGLVALRLVVPFSAESSVSVYGIGNLNARIEGAFDFEKFYRENTTEVIWENREEQSVDLAKSPVRYAEIKRAARDKTDHGVLRDGTMRELLLFGCMVLWIAGVMLLWMWGIISYISLKRRLRFAIKCDGNIYETNEIDSPCVVGIFPPRIYLTVDISGKQREYIILHEKMHIRYLDHIWKIISYLVVSVHWFNPFCWLMWKHFQGELEKACDERVLKRIGVENKEDYGESLLKMARDKSWRLSTPIAFGEEDTGNRIRRILRYRKPLITVSALVIILGVLAYGIFFTIPGKRTLVLKNQGSTQTTPEPEDIYEEIFDSEVIYQARDNGIYRISGGEEEQIYKGFPGIRTQMSVFEGKLYFLTDKLYEEGALDWADNTIRWIDLETLETGDLVLGREYSLIEDYRVYDGMVTVSYIAPEEVEGRMLYHQGEVVINDKPITELSEQEAQQFGMEMTDFILQNKGRLVNVSNRAENQNIAYLDMDGDKTAEKIVLAPAPGDHEAEADWVLKYYSLRIGDAYREGFAYNLANTLWAWSPDGKEIFLILYEDGPSADPCSFFYRYQDGDMMEVGSFLQDIRKCTFNPNGTITGGIFKEIVQTDWIEMNWQINEAGMLEEIPQESYDFLAGNDVELFVELPVYKEIGGGESFLIAPQTIVFQKISADFCWILLETKDGEQGWVHIENFQVPELNRNVMDVFGGVYMAG